MNTAKSDKKRKDQISQTSGSFEIVGGGDKAWEMHASEERSSSNRHREAREETIDEGFRSRIPISESDWDRLISFVPVVGPLRSRNKELGAELTEVLKMLQRRDWEMEQLRGRLSERERELGELKKTLCMYDDCSEVDIASMMNVINTRIENLALNAARRWLRGISKTEQVPESNPLNEEEMETLKWIVGPELLEALRSPPPEQSRCVVVLLPLAWQASVVVVVWKILSSFVAGLATSSEGHTVDVALQRISGLVKAGEIQPAYGRWRFVTHQYMKSLVSREGALQFYVKEAVEHCYLAARLALKSNCPDGQGFFGAFQTQMKEILEGAFKLRDNIQENMLTTNYDPYLPPYGTTFGPDFMEVDSKSDRQFAEDTVVCVTRLGMIHSRKRERENSAYIPGETFLKAQVLTARNLGDILDGK
ncbi:hypothetical protein FRC00_004471 [Tulasnella sp. 408]|nr:hypothetical protein FRC00_004471 [Tulasnella sp. 408]